MKQPPDFPTFSLLMLMLVLVFALVVYGAIVLQDAARMAVTP